MWHAALRFYALFLFAFRFFFLVFFCFRKSAKYMGYLALRSRLSLPLGHYHDGGSSSSFSNSSTKIDPLPYPLEEPSSAG